MIHGQRALERMSEWRDEALAVQKTFGGKRTARAFHQECMTNSFALRCVRHHSFAMSSIRLFADADSSPLWCCRINPTLFAKLQCAESRGPANADAPTPLVLQHAAAAQTSSGTNLLSMFHHHTSNKRE